MKVICPNCGEIINVSHKCNEVDCRKCNSQFFYQTGADLLAKKYKQLMNEGKNNLYNRGDYEEAIKNYSEAIKLKDNDFASISGICIALCLKSTFDDFHYKDVIEAINTYDIELNKENTFLLLSLFTSLVKYIKIYLLEVNNRFEINNTFASIDLFNYFRKDTQDCLDLINFIKDSLSLTESEEYEDYKKEVDTNFDNRLEEVEKMLKEKESSTFKVNHEGIYDFKGDLVSKEDIDEKIEISDDLRIFLPNTKFLKLRKWTFISMGLCLLALIALLILGFALNLDILKYLSIIPGLAIVIIYIIFYKKTK